MSYIAYIVIDVCLFGRSYSAVILLTGKEAITDRLPPSCNPSFHRFLATISPVKRFVKTF